MPPFNIPVDTKKNILKDSLTLGCESREFRYHGVCSNMEARSRSMRIWIFKLKEAVRRTDPLVWGDSCLNYRIMVPTRKSKDTVCKE